MMLYTPRLLRILTITLFLAFYLQMGQVQKIVAEETNYSQSKAPQSTSSQSKPNVIFVITDDQGYKDIAAHGHPYIQTPNLDALYKQSVRAIDFHVRPTCTPTRAAIMTGRDPMRSGIWHTIMGRSLMNGNEITLAETLQAGGYRTGLFGKWHLGDNHPMRPQDQGFDVVVQHKGGGVTQGPDYFGNDYFDDHYVRNGKVKKFNGFCTDVWFDETINFIQENRERPFFVYLSTNAPHQPWNVAEKYEVPYQQLGVAKTASPYYALISNIDENMGKLTAKLDELKLAENTILIFTTDNGPGGGWPLNGDKHSKSLPHFTANMKGAKGSCYEGGHRVPFFIRWPAGKLGSASETKKDLGREIPDVVADIDILPTIAELCGVELLSGSALDGKSFAKALHGNPSKDHRERYHVIQSQRRPIPERSARTVILQDHWRLVLNMKEEGSQELFDVRKDRRQSINLVEEHPQRAKEMLIAYDKWWKDQQSSFSDYSRISLGAKEELTACLMSHDWLTQDPNKCVWSQKGVAAGQGGNGPWAVNVLQAGKYRLELRRWPIERPGAVEANHAKLSIGTLEKQSVEKEMQVDPNSHSINFEVQLEKGPAFLQTWLTDAKRKNVTRGAYYVYVTRLGD